MIHLLAKELFHHTDQAAEGPIAGPRGRGRGAVTRSVLRPGSSETKIGHCNAMRCAAWEVNPCRARLPPFLFIMRLARTVNYESTSHNYGHLSRLACRMQAIGVRREGTYKVCAEEM